MTTNTKPYFIRAIHEWAEDNGLTPHVLVDASHEDALIPQEHVQDGQILLNISSNAIQLECMDNERIAFSARFGGVATPVNLPIDCIKAIYAKENGQGLFFEDLPSDASQPDNASDSPEAAPKNVHKPDLKIVK